MTDDTTMAGEIATLQTTMTGVQTDLAAADASIANINTEFSNAYG